MKLFDSAFWDMGGYAAYVWPSYGAFFVIFGGLILWVAARNRAVRADLARLEAQRRADQARVAGDTAAAAAEAAR